MKNYGVPYQGSKNRIAKDIVSFLPNAPILYDVFSGGCAVSHCAIETGKYDKIVINDINPLPTQLFVDSVNGKFKNETEFISRERFFEEKEQNGYIKYIWSFGNDGKTYIYGREKEQLKRAFHNAVIDMDFSAMGALGFDVGFIADIPNQSERRKAVGCYLKQRGITPQLESLQRLERLQGLEGSLSLNNVEILNKSYNEIEYEKDSVIYCDIPYKGTEDYSIEFDYSAFYEWALDMGSSGYKIFISEYDMPNGFECVWEKQKRCGFCSTRNDLQTIERIFIPKN